MNSLMEQKEYNSFAKLGAIFTKSTYRFIYDFLFIHARCIHISLNYELEAGN